MITSLTSDADKLHFNRIKDHCSTADSLKRKSNQSMVNYHENISYFGGD